MIREPWTLLQVLSALADSSDEVASTDLAHAITLHTFQEVRGPAVCGSPGARAAVGENSLGKAVAPAQSCTIAKPVKLFC